MTESTKTRKFEQAASLVKVQGILSIVFGSIGAFFGLLFMIILGFSLASTYNDADAIGLLLVLVAILVFWMLPHIYLIISGVTLARLPETRILRMLTIINIVIGVFWNYVLLVFAIISLVQINDYDDGYKVKRK